MTVVAPYLPGLAHDELLAADGRPRPLAEPLWRHLSALGPELVERRQLEAERAIRSAGLTFGGPADGSANERAWPFDVIPRVVDAAEWARVQAGVLQRLVALDCFIDDVYHDQRIVRAGLVPPDLVLGSPNFRPECMSADPPGGTWSHICGSDLVRDEHGDLLVLEDNLRIPSGVSYVLENRQLAKRVFPELFRSYSVEPVDQHVGRLSRLLASVSPVRAEPRVVVLTPGPHNAAYYEHSFLAHNLGVELVEGTDLVVPDDDTLYVRTIAGLERVDVVYRRVDDLYLDPEVFRRDSLIGVPGLMRAWRAGHVAIVNAPGTGVADDKAVYPFVPAMIRYYLGEEPLVGSVPTWRCGDPDDRAYVLSHLGSLVVKPANESGGYGIVIGPAAGPDVLRVVARRIEQFPRGWVAQPVVHLSTMPTLVDGDVVARHVDLRPFAILGPEGAYVTAGGLTRVARRAGSLVVNSSQGGGSKDTWVVGGAVADPAYPGAAATGAAPRPVTPDSAVRHSAARQARRQGAQ